MESKFGVTLKTTGAGSPGNVRKNPPARRTNTSGIKPANVNNLKAMFDGSGEGVKDSGPKKVGVGVTLATKSGPSGNRFGQDIGKSDKSKHLKDTDVAGSRFQKGQKTTGLFEKDFENYKFVIDMEGGEPQVALEGEPQVAVAKVFAEDKKAFQSTIEKKVHTLDSEVEVMDKDKAKSTLVEQLSLLRTRPGSGGKKEDRPILKCNSDMPSSDAGRTFLQKTSGAQDNKLNTQTKVTNTQPRKFVSTSKSLENSSKSDQDSTLSSSKVTKGAGFSNTRTSNVTQNKPIEFGLSFTKKPEADKDKNLVSHNRQSSSDSSGSFSPRSSILSNKSPTSYVSRQNSSGSDKNVSNLSPRSNSPSSTISSTRFEFNSSSSTSYQRQNSSPRLSRKSVEEVKPEWLDKSKQLVNQFQTKLKKPERSDTNSTTISKTETKTVTRTTYKSSGNSNVLDKNVTRKSADIGTSYLKKSDGRGQISKAYSLDNEAVLSRIQKHGPSRKISSDQFQKIKGGFEQIGSGSSENSVIKTADKPKPKFEIHTTKKLLERKHSFEMQKPDNIPKNVTLKVLRETGKVPKVKDFVQALNAGRQRSASTGSINNKINMADDIYEAVDGEEYHDAISQDWPATDSGTDSEAIYEYIAEPDPEGHFDNQLSKDGKVKYRVPTRRFGQKRRGVNRPALSVEEDEGILPDHSSSGFTTEGSSKEGTMESVDDRTGIDADIEYDSDSSNSGIYEPINPDFTHVRDDDGDTGNDTPPELPADRTKKKKKDKEGKSTGQKIGSKLKHFYKSKITSNQEPAGLHKVSSAPVVNTTSSAGVLNKIGGKLKLIKRTKSAEPSTLLEEEVVISSSDYEGSDTNDNPGLEESEPIMMKPFADIEYADSSSSSELISTEGTDAQPTYSNDGQIGEPQAPPPLPPRLSGNFITQIDGRTSPPLPPRNRISQNVNLDTVVPVSPGIVSAAHSTGDLRKGTWHLSSSKDSYLHGHNYKASSETNIHNDFSKGETTTDGSPPPVPPLPVPALPPKRNTTDETYLIPADKDSFSGVKLREKEPLGQRLSSGNSPNDPERNNILPPFEHMWKFKSQFEEEDIYIDLNNDSDLYGQLDRRYTTKFESEPLYQIYNKDKITRDSHKHTVDTHSDDESGACVGQNVAGDERIYEAVDEMFEKVKAGLDSDSKPVTTSPSKTVSTLELFGKTGSVLRALWCEMPEVKESGVLESISPQERKIQEAMFEIITSEASYLKSVNVLIDVFLMSQEFSSEHSDRCVINRQERHVLFSNIGAVRETSEQFLKDLEGRWQESVQLSDVCDIIYHHAAKKFTCYVPYCSNQTFQDRATQELMKKPEFSDAVRRLERTPECQGLPMISFLLLPMQRITRLPLLVDAICHRLEPGTNRHKSATRALDALNRVVKKCNDGAKRMQQTEQMCHLVQNLEFKVKEIPLISASRHLVKQGELTRIATDTSSKLPFGRGKPGKHSVHVYLFNDLILFSKKKRTRFSYSFTPQNLSQLFSNQYVVIDYAPRNALHVEVIDTAEAKAKLLPQGVPSGCKNIFLVAMLENHEQKQVEMVLSCKSPSERARWVDALTPVTKNDENEKIYEEWDCPQVHCISKYIAKEPDELTLEESDVINVFKKMADGWYEGERIRDGERGWFPSENTEEIVNSHVRAKNLRLRYRLLLASQDYSSTYSKA